MTHVISTIQERPGELRTPCACGAGRGSNPHLPVCISYPQPDGNGTQDQQEARRLRTTIVQLLARLDMPQHLSAARPLREQSGANAAQADVAAWGGEEVQIWQ